MEESSPTLHRSRLTKALFLVGFVLYLAMISLRTLLPWPAKIALLVAALVLMSVPLVVFAVERVRLFRPGRRRR